MYVKLHLQYEHAMRYFPVTSQRSLSVALRGLVLRGALEFLQMRYGEEHLILI
jgi:hypothetical protein